MLRNKFLINKTNDNELVFRNIASVSSVVVSNIGSQEILDAHFEKSRYIFLLDDFSFLGYCFFTTETEVSGDCFNYLEASSETEVDILVPQYTNKANSYYIEWWENLKPYIIDYSFFYNSFNFLTSPLSSIEGLQAHKNIYKQGDICPLSAENSLVQYWITMPIGTATCSSIDYNIIPLKNNLGINHKSGSKEYKKFNVDHDEISLIYNTPSFPIPLNSEKQITWPNYFIDDISINDMVFSNMTNGTFSGNSDWIYNISTSQSAWFLNEGISSMWINPQSGQTSDLSIAESDIVVFSRFDEFSAYSINDDEIIAQALLGQLDANVPGTYSYLSE
jgi:hypothetical protein